MKMACEHALLTAAAIALVACGGGDGRGNEASSSVSFTSGSPTGPDDSGGTSNGTAEGTGGENGTGPKLDVEGLDETGIATGGECAAIGEMADFQLQPADILFVLDNSGSMDLEAGWVQQYMNGFSSQIFLANIDARVIVISSLPGTGNGICIDPPLGCMPADCMNMAGCPGEDNNPPLFTHIPDEVGSNNPLTKIIQHGPDFAGVMRPEAAKHIVAVTDDDSEIDAAQFTAMWAGLDPSYSPFTFHAIAAAEDPVLACFNGTSCCAISAAKSAVYEQLVNQTGGVWGNLCDQDFQPVFDALATAVVAGATLSCAFDIPPPPEGMDFDPTKVNVHFEDGLGGMIDIGHVEDAADCANFNEGWYYDDNTNPTQIILCPQTCDTVQGFTMASIEILFGCATIPAG
jgi:hypothetical protein